MLPENWKNIEIASRDRVAEVERLASRFFREVIGSHFEDCLVTDESDLLDFSGLFDNEDTAVDTMLDRLEAHYFMDGRTIGSTRIVDLLEFLASRGVLE